MRHLKKGLFGKFGKKDKGAGKHANQSDDFIESAMPDGDNIIDDKAWEGGAFSNIAGKIKLPKKNKDEEFVNEEDVPVVANDAENEEVEYAQAFEGDADAPITSDQSRINSMVDPVPDFDQQIQEFHNASINMEV